MADNRAEPVTPCNAQEQVLADGLSAGQVVILPPMDATVSLARLHGLGVHAQATILDPWYNKGVGGIRTDYQQFIRRLLALAAKLSDHIFLWGFPEIVAPFLDKLPRRLRLVAWLTWYYKNSPSVIRGWRSSQMACLHLSRPEAPLYPEHFLNAAQKEKQAQGKLRYMPGPTSVIEEPLLVGFVGRSEQTGHPAQKPVAVFEKLLLMTTRENDLVLDPMCGSGTTGVAALRLGRRAVLCDESAEYTALAGARLSAEKAGTPGRTGSARPSRRKKRGQSETPSLFGNGPWGPLHPSDRLPG
jgi:DNA methylase